MCWVGNSLCPDQPGIHCIEKYNKKKHGPELQQEYTNWNDVVQATVQLLVILYRKGIKRYYKTLISWLTDYCRSISIRYAFSSKIKYTRTPVMQVYLLNTLRLKFEM